MAIVAVLMVLMLLVLLLVAHRSDAFGRWVGCSSPACAAARYGSRDP